MVNSKLGIDENCSCTLHMPIVEPAFKLVWVEVPKEKYWMGGNRLLKVKTAVCSYR